MKELARTKVLLIDDDPLFLRSMGNTFEEMGFDVITAGDGVEGLKAYLDNRPDVVITDLIMPRMGGVSTCMEITRRASSEHQPIIILMTSMFHGSPHEHELPEMGAKVHIPKSTPPFDVVIIVEQLLERARSTESGS
ncbi:response regulator MprA [Geobacter sp. OR-1]|uniref:response regulator transcription factor n=1 Tax=Geobacter sp. OR-1 TaxID=1266765 RepID=UPI0005426051|nr:response regulator [Geobacter sp. OR-1]GAM11691.1 response regulator MprA [Geobacter sp. OR-1]